MKKVWSSSVVLALVSLWLSCISPAAAAPISGSYFGNTWAHTDQPVASGEVNRTWMWGPSADSPLLQEPYAESPNGQRSVQYFDKSRMEITHPNGDVSSTWYVTNGLLAEELITGRLQVGDNTFEQRAPALVNVAGDANDALGPTYATFNKLMGSEALANGQVIVQTVDRNSVVGADNGYAQYNVTAKDVGSPTHHDVASVFWDFMNSSGTVVDNGSIANAKLFASPFYATGYPLTEPYWSNVLVGGVRTEVLMQVFERRVLTYTPSNPTGWKVEAGNVGQHYYTWRYGQFATSLSKSPNPPTVQTTHAQSNAVVVQSPVPPATTIGSLTFQHATFQYYEVPGSTADELQSSMLRSGPNATADTPFDANTSWDFRWSWDNVGAGAACHPNNVRVTYSITILFPHWTPPTDADPALVARWTQFTEALATHEDGHAIRVIENAYRVGDAIAGTSCANVAVAAQSALSTIRQISDQYDVDTQHGATQGAVWP